MLAHTYVYTSSAVSHFADSTYKTFIAAAVQIGPGVPEPAAELCSQTVASWSFAKEEDCV